MDERGKHTLLSHGSVSVGAWRSCLYLILVCRITDSATESVESDTDILQTSRFEMSYNATTGNLLQMDKDCQKVPSANIA